MLKLKVFTLYPLPLASSKFSAFMAPCFNYNTALNTGDSLYAGDSLYSQGILLDSFSSTICYYDYELNITMRIIYFVFKESPRRMHWCVMVYFIRLVFDKIGVIFNNYETGISFIYCCFIFISP